MPTPGATRSTPWWPSGLTAMLPLTAVEESLLRALLLLVAPTLITLRYAAGKSTRPALPLLPAAATIVAPMK